MSPLTFADLTFLFRTKNEDRWIFARQWIWGVLKPMFVAAAICALAYGIGFSLSQGVSAGLDVTFKLQLEASK